LAQTLADNLNAKTSFPNRVDRTVVTTFSDEMRAMAVLYRYDKKGAHDNTNPIFRTVNSDPAQLDQIEESLLNEILDATTTPMPRFANAPWMDIALGELGQKESNGSSRGTSNPRVCEYLDAAAAGLGDQGDTTPWCGAFVAWVLKHPHATIGGAAVVSPALAGFQPADNGLLVAAAPATALSWKGWARPPLIQPQPPVAGAAGNPPPMVGDVVVVQTDPGKFHTGFVFEVGGTGFWMLGGNQHAGSRVCLSPFPLSAIQ
jgi:hypothetical protein